MSGKAVRRQRRARDNAPDGTGSGRSYEELYVEYAPAARGLALSMVPPDAADDIVAEAFARVLAAIRAGGGPDHAFRAYLLATVRNLANDWLAARRRVTVIGDMGEEPGDRSALMTSGFSSGAETEAEARADARLIVRAFSRLPERWRTVLWQLEVEDRTPAEVAPMFGLSGNGISALAMRAREGLRQAYLQEHIGTNIPALCRACAGDLGAGARGRLSLRRQAAMQDHLHHCPACQDLFAELSELNCKLGTILAPIALAGTSAVLHGGRHGLLRAGLSAHWRAMHWHPVTAAAGAAASVAVAGGMLFAVNVTPLPGAPSHVAVQPAGPATNSGASGGHRPDGRRGGGGGGGSGAAGGTVTGSGAPVGSVPLGAAGPLPGPAPMIGTGPVAGPGLAPELVADGAPSSGNGAPGTSGTGTASPGGTLTGLAGPAGTTVTGLAGTVGSTISGLAGTAGRHRRQPGGHGGRYGQRGGRRDQGHRGRYSEHRDRHRPGVASTADTTTTDLASTADGAVTGTASTVAGAASTVAGAADTATAATTGTVGSVTEAAVDAVTNTVSTTASTAAASTGGAVTAAVTGVAGTALG